LSFEIAGEDVIRKKFGSFGMIRARLVFAIPNYVHQRTIK
jgi:hypothetical protein